MGRDEKIRWGILSTAGIGINHVIPGLLKSPHAEVVAISSRDGGRARAVADRFAIPRAYGSYEALLEDPEIDVVYNPLPNHLHVDFTLAAASKGKHVLCEKPIGITAEDARRLRRVQARGQPRLLRGLCRHGAGTSLSWRRRGGCGGAAARSWESEHFFS